MQLAELKPVLTALLLPPTGLLLLALLGLLWTRFQRGVGLALAGLSIVALLVLSCHGVGVLLAQILLPQYRSGIYYTTPEQKQVADDLIRQASQEKLFSRPIVTEVQPLANYWPAEEYHQDFFEKNPNQGYCMAVAGPKVAKFRKTFTELARR